MYTDGPELTMVKLTIFQLYHDAKQYKFSRNCASNFEIRSLPGLAICGKLLSPNACHISQRIQSAT